ncbi:MAG TPA: GntR family transcriptional regulator, partial [Rubrobacteraceae bacterium]|nr:GntR family transcriptional regulator [Rubrobacteraceae bacterium]
KLSTAQDLVLREIRQAIMTRRLKPGQRIRQWDLADRLNVSSVPVREALKTLEAEGQVTYEPYRGYKVVELSVEQVEEIYLARGLLEREVTRRAVKKIDEPLVRRLEESLSRMDELAEAGDVLGYTEANREFHFLLFEQAGLPRISHMIDLLWQNSEAYRGLIFGPEWSRRAYEDHLAILEACKAGDADRVIAAQERHKANAMETITRYLRDTETSPSGGS